MVALVGTTLTYPIVTESAVTHVVSVGNLLTNFLACCKAAGEESSPPSLWTLINPLATALDFPAVECQDLCIEFPPNLLTCSPLSLVVAVVVFLAWL